MGYIYKITNLINGKIYVGQTKRTIQERFYEHCSAKDNTKLHLAIQKYGSKNFRIDIIEECNNEILDAREIYWISNYNSYEYGYNMNQGGGGGGDGFKSANKYWESHPEEQQKRNTKGLKSANLYWENHPNERKENTEKLIIAGQNYWKTHKEEAIKRNKKFMEAGHKALSKQVLCIELNLTFSSVREAARQLGLSHSNISRACREGRTSGGYHWKYII